MATRQGKFRAPFRPAGESRFNSNAITGPTANQAICVVACPTAGSYLVTGGTSVDSTGTKFQNMQLSFEPLGTENADTVGPTNVLGIVSSYDGELELYLQFQSSGALCISAIAADPGVVYHVDDFTATRIGPYGMLDPGNDSDAAEHPPNDGTQA